MGDTGHSRLADVMLGEVQACAGHTHHSVGCNCQRTVNSILHRMRTDVAMVSTWIADTFCDGKVNQRRCTLLEDHLGDCEDARGPMGQPEQIWKENSRGE